MSQPLTDEVGFLVRGESFRGGEIVELGEVGGRPRMRRLPRSTVEEMVAVERRYWELASEYYRAPWIGGDR